MRTDTTVEPSSIHRRHAATVFLTDVQPDGSDGFVAAAILPDGHAYYSAHTAPANRRLDPMLVLETCRQAHNYLAHTYFEVEADAAFILNRFSLRVAPDAYTLMPAVGDGLLRMTLPAPTPQLLGRRTRGLAPSFALSLDGTPIGESDMTVGYLSAAAYRALRTRHRGGALITSDDLPPADRTGAVAPAIVGRIRDADVLLADLAGDRARLLVPVEHTGLFDHPLDHIPGTLFIEAARQFATALSPPSMIMTSMNATFHAFAELDAPVSLTAVTRGGEIVVDACQAGRAVATVAVALLPVR
ncbi:ScbA/BarX family gamma-butyrolactone biosynthesis protein [Paractinoplanes durhamensis]|uniref:Lactone biosynthesis protein n=1 Tax=Paractinoplanes durhamensis TaxID=113563 RepID=A0ABQ3YV74_9ACTN|nr:ScbA/BarX family gamma-butyrolactone biosynthesis protein [Actinoplanes durhamensis]GIE01463.1 lactone biosynthesis protein [Actinoplanes durhamensis]